MNGFLFFAILVAIVPSFGGCAASDAPKLEPPRTPPLPTSPPSTGPAALVVVNADSLGSGPIQRGQWETVFPFQVRNISNRRVTLVSVVPLKSEGVEIGGFLVTGPHVPSFALGVFKGWPPEPWPGDVDPDAVPTPKLSDFHAVDGFVVRPRPDKPEHRIAWGEHRLYSDLANEATIGMKYRLKPDARIGGVMGFRISYRLSDQGTRFLMVPHSGTGLCLEEISREDPDNCDTDIISQALTTGAR